MNKKNNTQKVIESIQSRSTIIKLKPLTKQFLKNIINNIKTNENIVISEKAENFILNICNNSVRLLGISLSNLNNEATKNKPTEKEKKSVSVQLKFEF